MGSTGEPPLNGHFRGGAAAADFYPASFGTQPGNGSFDITADLERVREPSIVAIHLGTNDLSRAPPLFPYSRDHGRTLAATRSAELAELVRYIAASRAGRGGGASLPIVVSLIIPAAGREQDVKAWNEAVIAMAEDFAEGLLTEQPVRIALADHHARFSPHPDLFSGGRSDWMGDWLHPNARGYRVMAQVYAAAIAAAATDTTPPAAVSDLRVLDVGMDRLTLTLTASGDDARNGQGARYDLRYSPDPITALNFGRAVQVQGEPAPGVAGAVDSLIIRGLVPGRRYFFAVKVGDEAGNRSPISNIADAATAASGRTTVTLRNGVDGYDGTADNTLFAGRQEVNLGAAWMLLVGATPRAKGAHSESEANENDDVNRTLLRFDCSRIPARARVHAARLRIYCLATAAWEPVTISAHRVCRAWTEGGARNAAPETGAATWSAAALGLRPWAAPGAGGAAPPASPGAECCTNGADICGEPIASAVISYAGTWIEWDLTAAVQAWVSGRWPNHGLLLKAAAETTTSTSWFYSAEQPEDAYLRPGLRIDYSLAAPAAPAGHRATESPP